MPTNYPTSLDALSNPAGTTATTDPTLLHSAQHGNANDAIEALQAKLGVGVSIGLARLTHVGAGNVLKSDGSQNVAGQVVDADVATGAGIAVAKIAHVGAGNVLKSSGSGNIAGQIVSGDIQDRTIQGGDIALASIIGGSGGVGGSHISPGTIYGSIDLQDNSISTAKYGDLSITDAKVANAAAIMWTKLRANGFANTVLATADGTNVSAQYAYNMIPANTLPGSSIQSGSITNAQIANQTLIPGLFATNAVGRMSAAVDGAAGSVGGSGVWSYMSPQVPMTGLVPGRTKVAAFIMGSVGNSVVSAVMQVGIGVDSVSGPSWSSYVHATGVNYGCSFAVGGYHVASAGGHTYYAVWNTNAGTQVRVGTTFLVVIAINE